MGTKRALIVAVSAILCVTAGTAGAASINIWFPDFGLGQENPGYYVDPAHGSDNNDGRSWDSALQTLETGIALANADSVAAGGAQVPVFVANSGLIHLADQLNILPGVSVVNGSYPNSDSNNLPVIRTDNSGRWIEMQPNSSMEGIAVSIAYSSSAKTAGWGIRALGSLDDKLPIDIRGCRIDGASSIAGSQTTGMIVDGGNKFSVRVADCTFANLNKGLHVAASGVNVTRCIFRIISGDAVFVQGPPFKLSGFDVPMLGQADDIENTALNQFRNVTGNLVNNTTTVQVQAEMNDWGVYSEPEIAQRITGPANSAQFLGKGIGPGSVVANVVDGSSNPIPVSASPKCTISALSLTGERDTASQRFIFASVPEGTWTVEASATGYPSASASASVSSTTVTPVTLQLAVISGTSCGQSAKAAYACCALVIWGIGRRHRRMRVGRNKG